MIKHIFSDTLSTERYLVGKGGVDHTTGQC
jgi:hypothetical protein